MRKSKSFQCADPLLLVFLVTPARAVLRQHLRGRFAKCRDPLRLPPLEQRIEPQFDPGAYLAHSFAGNRKRNLGRTQILPHLYPQIQSDSTGSEGTEGDPNHLISRTKPWLFWVTGGLWETRLWRRRRDSNPRYPVRVWFLSRELVSATHPRLRNGRITAARGAL